MRPLIYIPGFPGSELLDSTDGRKLFVDPAALLSDTSRIVERLRGPDDPAADDGVVAGPPVEKVLKILFLDFGKQAKTLYDCLRPLGYEPFSDNFQPVGWDWRRPVYNEGTLTAVANRVTELHDRFGQPVTVLVHSTGGLVLRAALESRPALRPRVGRIVAMGVPWAGTLKSLFYISGRQGFGRFLSPAQTHDLIGHAHAAFDLMPADPVRSGGLSDDLGQLDMFTVGPSAAKVQASPLVDRRWIKASEGFLSERAARSATLMAARQQTLPSWFPEVVNLVGWGLPTHLTAHLHAAKKTLTFNRLGSHEACKDGDGTVPRRSAAWLLGDQVRTFYIPMGHFVRQAITRGHSTLWDNKAGRDLLTAAITDDWPERFVFAAIDPDDASTAGGSVRVRIVAQRGDGHAMPGTTVRFLGLSGTAPQPLTLAPDGRLTIRVPRNRIVQTTSSSTLLRFRAVVEHPEWPAPVRRVLTVQKIL